MLRYLKISLTLFAPSEFLVTSNRRDHVAEMVHREHSIERNCLWGFPEELLIPNLRLWVAKLPFSPPYAACKLLEW